MKKNCSINNFYDTLKAACSERSGLISITSGERTSERIQQKTLKIQYQERIICIKNEEEGKCY